MTPDPTPLPPPPRGPARAAPTQGEMVWRSAFYGLSALMAAMALTDFDAGRFAHGLGDAGVACLLLSLMNQFPVVRAVLGAAAKREPPEKLQREAERLRGAYPWSDRLASVGWSLLFSSLLLRALGLD